MSNQPKRKTADEYMRQSDESFESINQAILQHLEERDWLGNHPRGLTISIALEANELLEHYQWRDEPVGSKEELAGELADILIYAFEFAQATDIDIAEAIKAKLAKAAKKYPARAFKGKDAEGRRAAWLEAKKNHKKEEIL